jgi:peptidoglycan/xylan/chitin deacetylase (PgdA/CDA1 family)
VEHTVFITGDVHQQSANNPDQGYLDRTEMEVALQTAHIAAEHDVSLTLFCTGKSIEEQPGLATKLVSMSNVELGGHTWNAFVPEPLHYAFRVLFGSFYGPLAYQRWDILRTLEGIRDVVGVPVRSWRGHALSGGRRTEQILRETSVKVVSNESGPDRPLRDIDSLFSLPINTRPDHDHIYHGAVTERRIRRDDRIQADGVRGFLTLDSPYGWRDAKRLSLETAKSIFGIDTASTPYDRDYDSVDDWFDSLREEVERGLDRHGFATVLAHPACQAVADDLETFERLCEWLSAHRTALVHEAPEIIGD